MTGARKIRVLIVEDSPVVQQQLAHLINTDPRLEVAGIAGSGEQALRMIAAAKPDVVSLDIRLPGIDGFAVTQRLMRDHPVPIVVVASGANDLDTPMRALQAGALAVVEKPSALDETTAAHLRTQLVIMSQVKVIRQRGGRGDGNGNDATSAPPAAAAAARAQPAGGRRRFRALGLVASTGGPAALVRLLRGLTPAFPLPVLVVQHIGAPFVAGFASWLGSVTQMTVTLAEHNMPARAGRVYVAPGNTHLVVDPGAMRLVDGDMVCGQRPSGDVLFTSMATSFGAAAIGVLLTGMGEDGARGLLDLHRAGGFTIAEDASTAVIHGMPGAAVRMGAANEELPIDRIAGRVIELVGMGGEP